LKDNIYSNYNRKKLLIHEVVHIHQHKSGKLKFIDNKYIRYKGIRYLRSDKNPPWEIDAKYKTTKILRLN